MCFCGGFSFLDEPVFHSGDVWLFNFKIKTGSFALHGSLMIDKSATWRMIIPLTLNRCEGN